MQVAVPVGTGAMAALMGLDLTAAEALCAEAAQGEVVEVANINSAAQIVIAGHRPAVERAVAQASAKGSRVKSVLLPVSAPFHCALMAPAAERLAHELADVPVADPRLPVVRNADGGVTRTAAEVKPFLLRQVASPVRWKDCMNRLADEGATAFVEVGPGRVLSGLVKRIVEGATGWSVEDPASLDRALAGLGHPVSELRGKVAVVTGGSRGIGAAIAALAGRAWCGRGSVGPRRESLEGGRAGDGGGGAFRGRRSGGRRAP